MRKSVKDITGQKFGRLTVLSFFDIEQNRSRWNCLCDCGTEKIIRGDNLKSGNTTSCGCSNMERLKKHGLTVGNKNRRLYDCWRAMLRRCYDPTYKGRKNYMDKGVVVCAEWKKDFTSFYDWSVANGYNDTLTLDRRDNDKEYSPENCRWVTTTEQNQNTSVNVLDPDKVRFIRAEHMKNKTFASIARDLSMNESTVRDVARRKTWKNIA